MLANIRIVLINTSHPGNIGATARAMKTMGLSNLVLVNPISFPDVRANEMASGALDVLSQATIVPDMATAIQDCRLIVGLSARSRAIPWPMLSPRALGQQAAQEATTGPVAIIFGREQSGLTNEELHACHFHVQIPSNPAYSSLNVAAAVQVIAYELRVASTQAISPVWDQALATPVEMDKFYSHLEAVLMELDFLKPEAPRQLMTRLKRLFNRARLDKMEMNIMRGILKAIEKISSRP